jgi:hypothetical protein
MPCCGKKRAQQARRKSQAQRATESEQETTSQSQPEPELHVYFQYLGKTGLTVIARSTRNRYRFDHPGAIVAVDRRDLGALLGVSVLRQVEKPAEAA